tara:strand:- start:5495 stop:6319 length:825 start_codon:yes stop_codon:yes gene_type:complete
MNNFQNRGSQPLIKAIAVQHDIGSVESWGIVETQGNGLQILSGVDAFSVHHQVRVFLLSAEDSTAEPYKERELTANEIFDGANIAGNFDKIMVRWTKPAGTYASETPPPVVVRIYQAPHRVGIVEVPRPHGKAIIETHAGAISTSIGAGAWLGIYDDDTPGVMGNFAVNLAQGQGVGDDHRTGRHFSAKRRLHLHVITTNTTASHEILVQGKISSGSYLPLIKTLTSSVVGPAATTQSATFGTEGVVVPGAIQIWIKNVAGVGAAFIYWITFSE